MFKPYSVKLTIEGLYGSFAEKYSFTIADAHHVDRLLQQLGARAADGPVTIADRGHENAFFEPFALIKRFIQYLRKIAATQPNRPFFGGVRFVPDEGAAGEWAPSASASDATGPLTVEAWGTRALVLRDGEEVADLTEAEDASFPVEGGRLVCQRDTFKNLFKPTFARLVEMCEESIAKNARLIANEVPHQQAGQGSGLPEFV